MAVELDRLQNYITHSCRTTIEDELLRILQSQSHSTIRRTGHARFRRGPSDQSTASTSSSSDIDQSAQNQIKTNDNLKAATKSTASSLISLIAGEEATVSNAKLGLLPIGEAPITRIYSSAKPPLPSTHRKRRHEIEQVLGDRFRSHYCHCCKKSKKIETTRRVRIRKGTSSSMIPSDEYCWKKYDQKLITGTSSRGGYYKCSSVKGCSARKHIIKDHNDPTVTIVTYRGEHNHRLPEILAVN